MANDWMIGQGFESIRAVSPEGAAEQEYFDRLDQKQKETGAINGSKLYDLDNGKTITDTVSLTELGKQAKQSMRDQQVAGQVASAKDQEIGAMYGRLKGIIENTQMENEALKSVINPQSLAFQG